MIPHSRLELFDFCTLSQTKLVEAPPLAAAHNHNGLYMGEHPPPPPPSPPGEKQMTVGENQSSKAHAVLGGGVGGERYWVVLTLKGGYCLVLVLRGNPFFVKIEIMLNT